MPCCISIVNSSSVPPIHSRLTLGRLPSPDRRTDRPSLNRRPFGSLRHHGAILEMPCHFSLRQNEANTLEYDQSSFMEADIGIVPSHHLLSTAPVPMPPISTSPHLSMTFSTRTVSTQAWISSHSHPSLTPPPITPIRYQGTPRCAHPTFIRIHYTIRTTLQSTANEYPYTQTPANLHTVHLAAQCNRLRVGLCSALSRSNPSRHHFSWLGPLYELAHSLNQLTSLQASDQVPTLQAWRCLSYHRHLQAA
ncbi:hypothetical protein BDP55DRAFT_401715 [Colletotrichum godetiae]|uniref:Uncharacterized protein n=1 Tax=Colletotrichum godetiae TaxID=1209918 RepID=A0AAJ0EN80_9PEZI|nr:uncharacterized protein BDP55DRAFT_401715 [Colletotrichum godetiae]KAK1658291.1 hypothetical protein BDP55DRAFT_401715 [Colletotrichum godetiae]